MPPGGGGGGRGSIFRGSHRSTGFWANFAFHVQPLHDLLTVPTGCKSLGLNPGVVPNSHVLAQTLHYNSYILLLISDTRMRVEDLSSGLKAKPS